MKRLVIQIALVTFSFGPTMAPAQVCENVVAMVDRVLPLEVGDPNALETLLNPRIASPQLGEAFRPHAAAKAVGDPALSLDRCTCDPPDGENRPQSVPLLTTFRNLLVGAPQRLENCTHRSPSGGELRTREREGRYTYVNPSRSHRGVDPNTIRQVVAARMTLDALEQFGVPQAEIDLDASIVRDVNLYAQGLRAGELLGEPLVVRAEVHPMFLRQVGGTPVWDSFASAAINTEGRIARLHVRWPDFCIVPGVAARDALTRAEVLAQIAARISANNPCNLVGRVGARLAYVEADTLDQPVATMRDAEDTDTEPRTCYLPAVVIAVFGPEPREDSDEISLAGELIAAPLFRSQGGDGGPAT